MGQHANQRAWLEFERQQNRKADESFEPPANDGDFEEAYSEWSADRRDREVDLWGMA